MNRAAGLLFILLCSQLVFAAEKDTLHSVIVQDDFVITVKKPATFSPQQTYHHVYITDGSLGMGEYILGNRDSWKANVPANCLVIAIAHTGNWSEKRSRDFIPSDISKNPEAGFGQADRFYLFLKKELIPLIERKYPNRRERVFIGHSFGGLFCLYTLFRDDKLFDRHFAISPSAWANYYELDKIEKAYFSRNKQLKAHVTIYAGTLEFLNKVLSSSRSFYKTVTGRNYAGLLIRKEEISGANHFSVRKPAVDKIFALLKTL